jgi:glycosyltransferase involved in cell wall biosynthesis
MMTNERPILNYETKVSGHHLRYVRLFIEALRMPGRRIILATGSDAPRTPEFAIHIAPVLSEVDLVANLGPLPPGLVRSAIGKARTIRRLARLYRPSHVYVPYGDAGLSQVLGVAARLGIWRLPPGALMYTIVMRGGFAYPCHGWPQRLYRRACLKSLEWAPWALVYLIDPIPFRFLKQRRNRLASRARLLPDPVDGGPSMGTRAARDVLGIPSEGRYVGCCGHLDHRKGIDHLVRAFLHAGLAETDRLLLAGKLSDEVRGIVRGEGASAVSAGRIVLLDRYLSNEEFSAAMSAMDVVCAPYPRHIGSASIVIAAASRRRPVLGINNGWIATAVTDHRLGWTSDLETLPSAMMSALEAAPRWCPVEATKFAAMNTPERFCHEIHADSNG